MWANWVNLVLGIWLIVAGFVLKTPPKTANFWNDLIVGIIVAILAYISTTTKRVICWINVVLGIWLIIAAFLPSIVGTKTGNLWNDLIVGIVVLIVAIIAALQKPKAA